MSKIDISFSCLRELYHTFLPYLGINPRGDTSFPQIMPPELI